MLHVTCFHVLRIKFLMLSLANHSSDHSKPLQLVFVADFLILISSYSLEYVHLLLS